MPEGVNLGTAYASIILDSSALANSMQAAKKTIGDGIGDIGKSLQSIGSGMTAIGLPFLGIAVAGQKAFDDMDDAADQLGAVLKSTANAAGWTRGEALKLGKSIQDLTGINRAQIVSGEAMLLTFTQIGRDTLPRATQAMTDLSVAMKQDIKSSAIQLGKALNSPLTGITALTRVGVTFSESQKDMIKTMVEAGNVAGAQGIILTEIEKEFGGSAAAAADPIDKLGATLNDLAIDIGVSLQPILEEIIPVIQDFAKGISQFLTAMSDKGDNTVGIILAIGAGLAILGPIVALIGTALAGIGTLIGVVLSPIGLIVAAVVGLFLAFQNNFLGIRDFLQPVIDGIGDFFAHFSDRVKLYASLALLYFEYYITNPLSDFWNNKLKPAFDAFSAWFSAPGGGLDLIKSSLQWAQDNVWNPLIDIVKGIWDAVRPQLQLFADWFISGGLQNIANGLTAFKTNAIDPFIKLIMYIWDQAKPGLELLKLGFQAAFSWIKDNVIQPILTAIQTVINALNQLGGTTQSVFDNLDVTSSGGFGGNNSPNINSGGEFGGIGTFQSPYVNSNGGFGKGVVPIPPVGGGSAAKRAGGGDVSAGMPYIVGEREPELFVPRQNGTILNGAQMGGGGFNMHGDIIIQANSAAEGRSGMRGALDEIEQRYRSRGN